MKKLCIFVIFVAQVCFAESSLLPSLGSMNKYPAKGYSACWGYTAPNGREYALLGVYNGLSIVDITDAPALKEIAFIANKGSRWTEMKTFGNYAYVVKDNADAGIQIIDLSDLPRSAKLVNTIKTYPQNHTITIEANRKLMFTQGGSNNGVTIWSLENPVYPTEISSFNSEAYVHDLYAKGNRAYLAEIMSNSFSIYDISDASQPKLIRRVRDPLAPWISFHNAWTTEDDKYLITTEETEDRPIRIWDISNEKYPVEVGHWIGPGKIPHNVHVRGKYVHVAHYGGGYRVVDLSDPKNPVEVAYFNNRETQQGFTGVWEVYPYFASGKIIMSSIEDGLLVTKFSH